MGSLVELCQVHISEMKSRRNDCRQKFEETVAHLEQFVDANLKEGDTARHLIDALRNDEIFG